MDNDCDGITDEGCIALAVSAVNPSFLPQGAMNQPVTITGSDFAAGASVGFSGTGIVVNFVGFVDSTRLVANVTIAPNAPTGPRDVTVTNPDGVGGTGVGLLTIVTQQGAINNMVDQVNQFFATGEIANQGIANSLLASLNTASNALASGNNNSAKGILGALIKKLDAFMKEGQITGTVRDTLVAEINALISSL